MAPRRDPIIGVDFLRFFAASIVALYHLAYANARSPVAIASGNAQHFQSYLHDGFVFGHGWVGVQIFFVISGFIIAFSACEVDAYTFIRGRFLRLAPSAWICVLLGFVVLLISGDIDLLDGVRRLLRALFFFPEGPWITDSFWTLPIEIVFYFCITMLLVSRKFRRIESLAWFLGGLSFLLQIGVTASPTLPINLARTITWAANSRASQLLLVEHGSFFALGIMAWVIWASGFNFRRLFAIVLFFVTSCGQIYSENIRTNAWFGDNLSGSIPILIFVISIVIFALSVGFNNQLLRIAPWLASPVRLIGLATYPLYLIHQPLGLVILRPMLDRGVNPLLALLLVWLSVSAFAIALERFAEQPLRRLIGLKIPKVSKYLPA